jgi:hypothetical protein
MLELRGVFFYVTEVTGFRGEWGAGVMFFNHGRQQNPNQPNPPMSIPVSLYHRFVRAFSTGCVDRY